MMIPVAIRKGKEGKGYLARRDDVVESKKFTQTESEFTAEG